MTDLIGRLTNVVWSFHVLDVVDVLVADQLKFVIVFYRVVGHQNGICLHLSSPIINYYGAKTQPQRSTDRPL